MEMQQDEIIFFREHLRIILNRIFLDRKINNAKEYFAVWLTTRKILEEELNNSVGLELKTKFNELINATPK